MRTTLKKHLKKTEMRRELSSEHATHSEAVEAKTRRNAANDNLFGATFVLTIAANVQQIDVADRERSKGAIVTIGAFVQVQFSIACEWI